jgi:DNA-binding GntR family transcriptional regulator
MIIQHATTPARDGHGTTLKRDQAYAALYQEIVRLRLAPGAIIDESALNQYPGLGRTPIREALHQLASEGLVTIYPRRGMVVTPINLLDVQQQTEARLVFEPNVVRLAAKVGTVADWDVLEALLETAPVTIETEDDVARASDVDRRFHYNIAAATGNRYLAELVDRIGRMRARMPFLFFRHGTYQPVTDQHVAILARLRTGDAEGAARLVEEHIKLTQERQTRLRL